MSIASEITRINTNIAAAYTACNNKGATMPQAQNSGNLANTIGSISTQTDQSKITYNITPTNASQFITAARAAYANSSASIVDQYLESGALPVSKSESISGNIQLTYLDGKTVNDTASGSYSIKNVSPNGARLSVVGNDFDTTVSKMVKPTGTIRFIDSLCRNSRDLGGWPCDGGTIKYGLLYRTAFYSISDSSYQNKKVYIDRLGVLHQFDLRGTGAAKTEYFPIGHYHSYAGSIQFDQVVTGSGNYDTLLKEILTDVMTATIHGEPLVFHCSQGCDRTGTLAFYLEAILGVSDIDIDIDFELSSLYDDGSSSSTSYYRKRTDEVNQTRWTYLKNKFSSYAGSSLSAKVINYLLSIGISADLLNEFRSAAIDGTPSEIVAPMVTVTGTYTNCSTSNSSQTTALLQPYSAMITAASGYTLTGATVSIMMGNTDITATAYSNGTISIASVTDNLTISVSAAAGVVNLFDPTNATKDNETNYRLNSSGEAVALASSYNYSAIGSHILVTDFIPVSGTNVLHLVTDHTQDVNSYAGYISVYKLNGTEKVHLKQAGKANGNWTWTDNNTKGSFNISGLANQGVDVSQIAYCRLCIAYDDIDIIVITST